MHRLFICANFSEAALGPFTSYSWVFYKECQAYEQICRLPIPLYFNNNYTFLITVLLGQVVSFLIDLTVVMKSILLWL